MTTNLSKKLFRVTVEAEMQICVMAESPAEAQRLAEHSISDELDARSHDIWHVGLARPVTHREQIDEEWTDAIPYGGDGEKTVSEILATPIEGAP